MEKKVKVLGGSLNYKRDENLTRIVWDHLKKEGQHQKAYVGRAWTRDYFLYKGILVSVYMDRNGFWSVDIDTPVPSSPEVLEIKRELRLIAGLKT